MSLRVCELLTSVINDQLSTWLLQLRFPSSVLQPESLGDSIRKYTIGHWQLMHDIQALLI